MSRTRLFLPTLVGVLALATTSSASANIGGFEGGDGNQASACGATYDWACLASSDYRAVGDTAPPNDDIFGASTDLNAPDGWTFTNGTVSPNKADIQAAWASGATTTAGNFFQIAFVRPDGGATFAGFELNQNPNPYNNSTAQHASVVCRTAGDVLISYEFGGSSATPAVFKWVLDPPSSIANCPTNKGHWAAISVPSSELSVSTADLSNTLAGVQTLPVGTVLPAGTFGEAAFDLNSLANAVGGTGNPCTFFKRLQETTRTSPSFNSGLQDILPATDLLLAACRTAGPGDPQPPSGALTLTAAAACTSTGTINLTVTGDPNADVEILRYAAGSTVGVPVSSGTLGPAVPPATKGSAIISTPIAAGSFTYKATYAANTAVLSAAKTIANPCSGSDGDGGGGGGGDGGSGSDGTPTVTQVAPSAAAPGPAPAANPIAPGLGVLGKVVALCKADKFRVTVKYKGAKRMDFMVGKRTYATARKASKKTGAFSAVIDPLRLVPGNHSLKVKIFIKGRKKPVIKKLRSFKSCSYKCASRRAFKIRIPKVRGETVVRALVFVNHKQVKVVRGARLTAPVNLRGLPRGRFTVDVTAFTASGKAVKSRRAFKTCTKKQLKKKKAATKRS